MGIKDKALALCAICSAIVIFVALPQSATADDGYGALFYNQDNVACVVNASYKVGKADGEKLCVTVENTAAVGDVLDSGKAFVSFGGKLDEAGAVEVTGDDTCALVRESVSLSPDGMQYTVIGRTPKIDEHKLVFAATGLVGGNVSWEMNQEAMRRVAFSGGDDYDIALVNMPDLNDATARIWASRINGSLSMFVHEAGSYPNAAYVGSLAEIDQQSGNDGFVVRVSSGSSSGIYGFFKTLDEAIAYAHSLGYAEISEGGLSWSSSQGEVCSVSVVSAQSPMGSVSGIGGLVDIEYDFGKYRGYYPNFRPLGDSSGDDAIKTFEDLNLGDAWIVDGDGYLWYIAVDGTRCCYGDSFFAIAENAYNGNAITELTEQSAKMADNMSARDLDEGCYENKSFAIKYRGVSLTVYIPFELSDVGYDVPNSRLVYTETHGMRLSLSYASSTDLKMAKNFCGNARIYPFQ